MPPVFGTHKCSRSFFPILQRSLTKGICYKGERINWLFTVWKEHACYLLWGCTFSTNTAIQFLRECSSTHRTSSQQWMNARKEPYLLSICVYNNIILIHIHAHVYLWVTFISMFISKYLQLSSYWCLVGNGWEWGNGMIIDYCGSSPHSLLSTSNSLLHIISYVHRIHKYQLMYTNASRQSATVWPHHRKRSPRETPPGNNKQDWDGLSRGYGNNSCLWWEACGFVMVCLNMFPTTPWFAHTQWFWL